MKRFTYWTLAVLVIVVVWALIFLPLSFWLPSVIGEWTILVCGIGGYIYGTTVVIASTALADRIVES